MDLSGGCKGTFRRCGAVGSFRRAVAVVIGTVLLAGASLVVPAVGQELEIFRNLRSEPVSLFDYGVKALRRLALEAASRMAVAGEAVPTVQVGYSDKTSTIEIQFVLPPPATAGAKLSPQVCEELRKALIRETFKIGRTAYDVPLSVEERVRRRLAMQFAHEIVQTVKETVALGERLSELTFFEVKLTGRDAASGISCRSPVAKLQMY